MSGPTVVALLAGGLVVAVAAPWAGRPAGTATRRLARAAPSDPAHPAVAVPPWFAGGLAALDLAVDPVRAWPVVLAVAVLAGAGLAVAAPGVAVAVGVVAIAVHGGARWGRRRRRPTAPTDDDLLALLAEVAASLRGGASLARSLEVTSAAGPLAVDLRTVSARAAASGLADALDRWASARSATGVPLVVDALAIAGATGASQVLAVEAVAHTLRDRRARAREVRALAAQARASALVLVVTPLAFAGAAAAWDPRIGAFLLGSPAGWACLGAGLALDAAGAWWMAVLVRSVR